MEATMSDSIIISRSLVEKITVFDETNENASFETYVVTMRAIGDTLTLINHVKALFDGKFAKKYNIIDWLDEVEDALDSVAESINNNTLPIGDRSPSYYEERDLLESALDEEWPTLSLRVLKNY
jgi:hypothetical protein